MENILEVLQYGIAIDRAVCITIEKELESEMAKCGENRNFPKILNDVCFLRWYLGYEIYTKPMPSIGNAVQCIREIAQYETI